MGSPNMAAAWRVKGFEGFNSLELEKDALVQPIGDHDCLVKIEAASLNYRDLMIPKVGHIAVI